MAAGGKRFFLFIHQDEIKLASRSSYVAYIILMKYT